MPVFEHQCPLCEQKGTIDCPEDFHPEVVFCLTCEEVFRYPLTLWQYIVDLNDDFSGAVGVFFLQPSGPQVSKPRAPIPRSPVPALSDIDWLSQLPLKYVLKGYQNRHRPWEGNLRFHWNGDARDIQTAVIKSFLDAQPHIPRKNQKPSRKQRKLGVAEIPTVRQYEMSRSVLIQVAQRSGFVQWRESRLVEQVRWENNQVVAYRIVGSLNEPQLTRSHQISLRASYFCREHIP
jgi:hypothetical protein